MLFAPIAAQLIQRRIVSARTLLTSASSLWLLRCGISAPSLPPPITCTMLGRAYQGWDYGFFFVPVNVLAYSQLRPDRTTKASTLTNFSGTGEVFWDCLHYHRCGTPASVPSNKSRISNWRYLPTARCPSHYPDDYLVTKRLFRAGRRVRGGTWVPLSAVQHQVACCPFMLASGSFRADIGRGPVVVVGPAFKPAGKSPAAHMSTEPGEWICVRPDSHLEEFQCK